METTLISSPSPKEHIDAGEGAEAAAQQRHRNPFAPLLRLRAFEALGYRDFRLLWFGHVFASMAFWMDQVSRGWLIYELTDSTVQLGLVRGVQAIPILLLSPIAGSAADRYSRKMQILIAQIIDGSMLAALAVLILTGLIEPWHIYATAFGMAMVQTFQQPARAAIVADVVPGGNLTNAIGLNSIIFNVARSTGPALAGVLIATSGTGGAYATQAAFFLLATYWTVRLRQTDGSASSHRHGGVSFGRSIIDGWKFSWQNEIVRAGLLITILASLFIVPFMTLLPVFARDILAVGASGQGLLLTAMGVGALTSAVILASFGDRIPRGVFMLGGVIVNGLGVVVFAFSPWFNLSMFMMVIAGCTTVCSHALVQTVLQTYSPPEFRGRTIALFHMGSQVVFTVGSMLIGALAAVWGTQWAVASMGIAGVLAMAGIQLVLPRTRHIR